VKKNNNYSFVLPFDIWKNKLLVLAMVKHEILSKYRGSYIGLLWAILYPMMMLGVFTFVFSGIFQARWSVGQETSTIEFALILFCGLLLFNFFADSISRAPSLVLRNTNFVKKVIFPLEILSVVDIAVALFHWVLGMIVWLGVYLLFIGIPHLTVLWFPVIIGPAIFIMLGLSWFLAALGVYIKDVAQIIGVVVSALMFLSPVFYPLSAIPEKYQGILVLNPLTVPIEQMRQIMYWGIQPNFISLGQYTIIALLICIAGRCWFEKTRRGFADVL
jgi:lipopolysaccharide transport system permease protein